MEKNELYYKLKEIEDIPQCTFLFDGDTEQARRIAEHRARLKKQRHEIPCSTVPYKVGIYIRYFNQTNHQNYLSNHKKQFLDAVQSCQKWTFIDFYIDGGSSAPNMESSPQWSRLLNDCVDGKVDLIITQKISNVSKKIQEMVFCARLLAAQNPPVGIYFVSEDIFTLASYCEEDLKDTYFFPSSPWRLPTENEDEERGKLHD